MNMRQVVDSPGRKQLRKRNFLQGRVQTTPFEIFPLDTHRAQLIYILCAQANEFIQQIA